MARQIQMEGSNNNSPNDTKLTKIFVGGLAWETQRDTMRRYFEQFGEIIEAAVITDKNTGRSKGYGFVTFKEVEAAMRACQNMNPVIDGRKANCNLACLGAQKPHPLTSPRHGTGRFRSAGSGIGLVASSSSAFVHHQQQHTAHFPVPYSAYGFSGYSQEGMYPMSYYNHHLYGGHSEYSPYMRHPSSGMYHGCFYPFYAQYNAPQSSYQSQAQAQHHQGFSFQYTAPLPPTLLQYPYAPHQQHLSSQQQFSCQQPPPPPILSLPTSLSSSTTSTSSAAVTTTTTTKAVVITTKTTAAEGSTKDDQEAIATSSIKIKD